MKNDNINKVRGVFEKVPGSGVWWIQFFDSGGRRRREKVGRKSVAIKLVEKRRADAREGVKMPANLRAKPVTFAEIAKRALDHSQSKKRDYRHDRLRMPVLVAEFGHKAAADITPGEIEAWIYSHAEWKPATKNRYLALMKLAYRLAEKAQLVSYNPARLLRQAKEDNCRIRYLLDAEETTLRAVIEKMYSDHLPDFEVALMTGMRLSEQFGVAWEDVDLDAGIIHLSHTKNGSARHVRLNSRAMAVMRMLHDRSLGAGRVFTTKYPFWFASACQAAGLKDFTWHCLRHTFASRLVMAGVDIRTVQELMGHKSILMTMRYSHLSPEHRAKALEKLCQPTATTSATSAIAIQ
jgi:site-specific recombinase XerD